MEIGHCFLDGNADVVEFCPHDSFRHVLATSTYTLQEGDHPSQSGSISLFNVDAESRRLQLFHCVETAGIFDINWSPGGAGGAPSLAQVDADGYLRVHHLDFCSELLEDRGVEIIPKASRNNQGKLLQDAGCWTDAATLAASHLKGSDYARVLQRWADHVHRAEHTIWRALILYAAAGSLQEALAALREAQLPDTAAMFMLACRDIHADFTSILDLDEESCSSIKENPFLLPGLNPENEDVIAVCEYFGQYQRKLVHLCMDSQPFSE